MFNTLSTSTHRRGTRRSDSATESACAIGCFAAARHAWLSARPDLFGDGPPTRDASGALGRVTVSDEAPSWLQTFTDRDLDDLIWPGPGGLPMPPAFGLRANWTQPEQAFAVDLVTDAFESRILEHPDQLRDVSLRTPCPCQAGGRSYFTVEMVWSGYNPTVRLTSGIVFVEEIAPGNTAPGHECALMLLRVVADIVSGLLDDLAAEGVRTTDHWHDIQNAIDAAADDVSYRQRPRGGLRRWLPRLGTSHDAESVKPSSTYTAAG